MSDESRFWSSGHSRWRDARRAAEAAGGAAADAELARRRRLQQQQQQGADAKGDAAPAKRPLRVWVEYQAVDSLDADVRAKLRDTVSVALGVLQKYFSVRRPHAGPLRAPPLCVVFDSAGYCNLHQPDFLGEDAATAAAVAALPGGGGGGRRSKRSNMCGLARINGSHVAPYKQCSLGGGTCREYAGGEGEHADYYLYITAQQDGHCESGAVAWALPCLYDADTNRPLLVRSFVLVGVLRVFGWLFSVCCVLPCSLALLCSKD